MKDDAGLHKTDGFTLVELMIAMLILAIGIMAVLSMQFTSLGGAAIARDNANAADIARRITNVMRIESQQWRSGTLTSGSGLQKVYDDTETPWKNTTVLGAVATNGGTWNNATWVSLFTNPVDSRLSNIGTARYCAYARGAYLGDDIFQVQIAVVFPAPNQAYDSNGCLDTRVFDNLDPVTVEEMEDSPDGTLQGEGFRVQYYGAQILRRAYLAPGGGVSSMGGA